ncbi:MAG TPA: aldo/keto reductase [Vicinamibacteria bacterium]|nr:aldo/keto reductase [Vicinamibacteria bacterium]
MKMRRLGRTGLDISVLGLGSWVFGGGGWSFGWGDQDDRASIATIHRAVESGMNWIDTAPVYGLGHAEEVVGRALRDLPSSRRPLLFTKCGIRWRANKKITHSLLADSLSTELEQSLVRLGVETVDLYQIHWPDYPPDGPAPSLEEGWETLARFREQGKVRHIGVSNFDVSQLERARRIAYVESLQPPYSLLNRDAEQELFPYCSERDIGVIVYSPLQSGLLSGKMTPERIRALPETDWRKTRSLDFREPRLSRALKLVDGLRPLASERGCTVAASAIAWTLRHPAVTGAIVGARNVTQLDELTVAAELNPHELNPTSLS